MKSCFWFCESLVLVGCGKGSEDEGEGGDVQIQQYQDRGGIASLC